MEMKMVMNNYIFDAIRASLTKDINKAYNIFKDKYNDVIGVSLLLNTTRGFGEYLKNHPDKVKELLEPLYMDLKFPIKLIFTEKGEEEFYPLFK